MPGSARTLLPDWPLRERHGGRRRQREKGRDSRGGRVEGGGGLQTGMSHQLNQIGLQSHTLTAHQANGFLRLLGKEGGDGVVDSCG